MGFIPETGHTWIVKLNSKSDWGACPVLGWIESEERGLLLPVILGGADQPMSIKDYLLDQKGDPYNSADWKLVAVPDEQAWGSALRNWNLYGWAGNQNAE